MSRSLTARLIFEMTEDTGLEPSTTIDSAEWPALPVLSGFKVDTVSTIVVAPAAADVQHAIGDVIGLIILSDQPVSMRLAAAETLITKFQAFVILGKDQLSALISGPLRFSGNGSNEAIVKVWALVKP